MLGGCFGCSVPFHRLLGAFPPCCSSGFPPPAQPLADWMLGGGTTGITTRRTNRQLANWQNSMMSWFWIWWNRSSRTLKILIMWKESAPLSTHKKVVANVQWNLTRRIGGWKKGLHSNELAWEILVTLIAINVNCLNCAATVKWDHKWLTTFYPLNQGGGTLCCF